MHRVPLATCCLLLVACSAAEARPDRAFGRDASSLGPGTGGDALAVPAAETAPATEASLRRRLASDAEPTPAALLLVQVLDAEERLIEALAVLDTALRRAPGSTRLQVARAGVLRDLGRRDQALVALRGIIEAAGVAEVHPGLALELVELYWLEGDPQAARQTAASIRREHAGRPELAAIDGELTRLEGELDTRDRPQSVKVRDLLGNLRGAPLAGERRRALAELLVVGGEAARRAIAVSLDDADEGVRAAGVEHATGDAATLTELCAAALVDPAPRVRAAAARRTHELVPATAVELLLPALAAETDAAAFVAEHVALGRCGRPGPEVTEVGAGNPAQRAFVVAAWRQQWGK